MKITINVMSRRIQKTEEVDVEVKVSNAGKGSRYLYFEGRDLIGYVLLPEEVIKHLSGMPDEQDVIKH